MWCVCLQLPGYPDVVFSVYSCLDTLMWYCLAEDPAVWHTERTPSRPSSPTMRRYGREPSTLGKETQSNGRQQRKSEVEMIIELLWLPDFLLLSVYFFFAFLSSLYVVLGQFQITFAQNIFGERKIKKWPCTCYEISFTPRLNPCNIPVQ